MKLYIKKKTGQQNYDFPFAAWRVDIYDQILCRFPIYMLIKYI